MLIKPKLGQEKLRDIWSNAALGIDRGEKRGEGREEEERKGEKRREEKRSLTLNRV